MEFYKGGLSYNDLQNMPIPEIYRYQKYAKIINTEKQRAFDKGKK